MTHRLLGITPDTTLGVAARILAEAGVRHLPVLAGDRCIGVLTEAAVLRELTHPDPPLGPVALVGQVCGTAAALNPGDRRGAAAAAMERTGTDAVLVVEHDRLVGIVTATDLVRSLVPSADRIGTSDAGSGLD
jgi:CBS domain-containing protein